MPDNGIFDDTNDIDDLVKEATQIDPDKDYYTELVGEDKQYKTPQAVARAVLEKENFIKRLEAENLALRSDQETRVSLEEIMDKMKSAQLKPEDQNTNPGNQGQETPPADGSTPEQIEELIEARLTARQEKDRRAENAKTVKAELAKTYGKDYVSRLKARGQELGVTTDFLNDLAETNPTVFFELINRETARQQPATPPRTAVNTTGLADLVPSEKRYSDYRKEMKENPRLVGDAKYQNLLFQEAKRQGASFYT